MHNHPVPRLTRGDSGLLSADTCLEWLGEKKLCFDLGSGVSMRYCVNNTVHRKRRAERRQSIVEQTEGEQETRSRRRG